MVSFIYTTPLTLTHMSLKEKEQVLNLIHESKEPVVAFRPDYTTDGVAGALAMSALLKKLGKDKTSIVSSHFTVPKHLAFLPGITEVKSHLDRTRQFIISLDTRSTKVDTISYNVKGDRLDFIVRPKDGVFSEHDVTTSGSAFRNDLAISINTPDLEHLGELYMGMRDFFFETPILNIDYRPENEHYGQINMVDVTATSVSEVIARLFLEYDQSLIDADTATLLLCGMIAETKGWHTPNVTPKVLLLASSLMEKGARKEEIMNNLYRSRSLPALRLWGRVLTRLQYDAQYRLAWSVIPSTDFEKTEAREEDLTGIIDELIGNAPEAKVIVVIYQKHDTVCALLSTGRKLNALKLVSEFEPDGSQSLAKFCITEKDISKGEKDILGQVRKMIDAIPKEAREL